VFFVVFLTFLGFFLYEVRYVVKRTLIYMRIVALGTNGLTALTHPLDRYFSTPAHYSTLHQHEYFDIIF
jgi:hypothetical protein